MTFLLAQAAQGEAPNALLAMAPMFFIFLIFYVIWFLPLRRKQKQMDDLIAALEKGDKVVTQGGLYGKVVKVEDDELLLEIAEGVRVRCARRAVSGKANPPDKGKTS